MFNHALATLSEITLSRIPMTLEERKERKTRPLTADRWLPRESASVFFLQDTDQWGGSSPTSSELEEEESWSDSSSESEES